MQSKSKAGLVLLTLGVHSASLMAQEQAADAVNAPEQTATASAASSVTAPSEMSPDSAIASSPELSTIPVPPHESKQPIAKSETSNRLVEEVVVTSQKREEKLQEIPLSVQAFSQEKLDALNIQTVQQIQQATPGFLITRTAGYNLVFLRGVGSDAFLPGVDSSVPFYLDGVPLLAAMSAADQLGRVKRVEVLKGPQGTLFGRNATGGTISVVTPDPDYTQATEINLGAGGYNKRTAQVFSNVPVTDTVAFTISGYYNYIDNPNSNIVVPAGPGTGGVFNIYGEGGRIKLKWDAFETVSFAASGSYQKNSGSSGFDWQMLRPAPVLSAIIPADPKFDRKVQHSLTAGATSKSSIYSGTVNWNPEYFDGKITFARQRVDVFADADFDGTERFLVDGHVGGFGNSKQFIKQDTGEIQILSNKATPLSEYFEWVAGLFYLHSDGGFDPIVFNVGPDFFNAAFPAAQNFTGTLNQALAAINISPIFGLQGIELANYGLLRSTSYSGYAQGTYHVIDRSLLKNPA